MKLAVDALNLRNDRRGMGRIVRGVLRVAAQEGIEPTLLLRDAARWDDIDAVRKLPAAHISTAADRGRYDAVWYPWNGMRFETAAPALAHVHDTFALHERVNWIARRRIVAPLYRAARRAARIATDSHWSKTQIENELRVPAERIVVIPLAPDPFFQEGADDAVTRRPYVLMVGAGDRRKNGAFLVAAFAQAFPNDDVSLVIAGAVSREAEREAARRQISLVRETPDDERLRALYRNAACVAVPSLAEGFGLVVVEAQACGAAVIASNATALPEAAGDAALLLPPDDAAAWRDALREVVFDAKVSSGLRELAAARWRTAERDGAARAILAALRNLVDQRT